VSPVLPLPRLRDRGVEPGPRAPEPELTHCWALRNQAAAPSRAAPGDSAPLAPRRSAGVGVSVGWDLSNWIVDASICRDGFTMPSRLIKPPDCLGSAWSL
jgi:hypothetical protein